MPQSSRASGSCPQGICSAGAKARYRCARTWSLPIEESFAGSMDEAAEALTAILSDAVASHLVSDVPIGALLSGGVDSSLVVALMARNSSGPVKTFTIGFDEPRVRRSRGRAHGSRSTSAPNITSTSFGLTHCGSSKRLVEHFDEPFGDSSAIPTWYVSKMASRHVKVVLSGDGGDELFGGYDRYVPHPRVESFDRTLGTVGRRTAAAIWPVLPHGSGARICSAMWRRMPKAGIWTRSVSSNRTSCLSCLPPKVRRVPESARFVAAIQGAGSAPLAEPDVQVRFRHVPSRRHSNQS